MTDKLHCPFCGAELLGSLNEKYCTNRECEHYMRTIPTSIWQALIDGKKAQRQLRTIKDRCAKKLKAKEREIASCLNGISVRQSENEKLAKQLKKAQDALLFISNIRGAGMSYQGMFLDAQAVAKYASGRTSDLVLVGRYSQDELNEITKQEE